MSIHDRLKRPLRDLRVSVTDRCNLRCTYCMPKEVFGSGYPFLQRRQLLRYEEITRLAKLFVACGVRKIRITGGEPLLRREIPRLVKGLALIPGVEDLTLTTNGLLLPERARLLREAGLKRITVSLDSLDETIFQRMNGVGSSAAEVLSGIEAAAAAGFDRIKVNAVIQKGVNDGGVLEMARHFRGTGVILRFIEYMDVGNSNGWRLEQVVSAAEILETISRAFPLEPLQPSYRGEVASRWRYRDGAGEIGLISSVTQPFCSSCTRARLSPEGHFYTCLFGSSGTDLRTPLRQGASDEQLLAKLRSVWFRRQDRYSEFRTTHSPNLPKVEMSHIGG